MKILILMSLIVCLPFLALAQSKSPQSRKLFPYDYTIDDLPNGLRLVTVPTDYPNLVALYIVVQAGSRNEVEAGKTGFAHFFEHIMFRGSEHYTADQREAISSAPVPRLMPTRRTTEPSITPLSRRMTLTRS